MTIYYELLHFTPAEFDCKCINDCNMKFKNDCAPMDATLMVALDIIRKIYARPIRVNSGKRCEAHNKAVGGAVNSKHTRCKAVDIAPASPLRPSGTSPGGGGFEELKACVIAVDVCGFFGLKYIVYEKERFVHIER